MRVAIIKYNAGNVQSVAFALERLGIDSVITDDVEQIQSADKVIFPGVGEASSTMRFLKSKRLDETIRNLRQPVLGICLGMQLMCRNSAENNTDCLGIFDEDVLQFTSSPERKVPHMGWNQLRVTGYLLPVTGQLQSSNQQPVTSNWPGRNFENQNVYFVHSFYVPVNKYTSATCEYGIPFSAAMQKDNFHAVQFHPEKSAEVGSSVLQTFLSL